MIIDGLRDVAATAVSSSYCANSTWRDGVDKSTLGYPSLHDKTWLRGRTIATFRRQGVIWLSPHEIESLRLLVCAGHIRY
jgi:hypothetical protein